MKSEREQDSPDFGVTADSVFQTFLAIATILSGVYVSVAFGWFGQALSEPHPGEPMRPEAVTQATIGIFLGLIFILPLVVIIMAWAFSKFRGSMAWRTVAWSGLIYCLTQDFIGLIALVGVPLLLIPASSIGGIYQEVVTMAIPLVILIPPVMGAVLGYRVSVGYVRGLPTVEIQKSRHALTALVTAGFILGIQALLGLTILLKRSLHAFRCGSSARYAFMHQKKWCSPMLQPVAIHNHFCAETSI